MAYVTFISTATVLPKVTRPTPSTLSNPSYTWPERLTLSALILSGSSASLGAAPKSLVQRDLFHPEHENTLRAHIRAALRGEDVPTEFATIPTPFHPEYGLTLHPDSGSIGTGGNTSIASLGGAPRGLCVAFDTVAAENDVEAGYAADMPWPEKVRIAFTKSRHTVCPHKTDTFFYWYQLSHDPRSPNSFTINMPKMTTEACVVGKGGVGIKIPRYVLRVSQILHTVLSLTLVTVCPYIAQHKTDTFRSQSQGNSRRTWRTVS